MSRPRRVASQKVFEKQKLDLSDISDEDSDGDFSSESSDEYNPNKSKSKEETFEESEDEMIENESSGDEEEEESFTENYKENDRKSNACQTKKSNTAALRKEAISKLSNIKLNLPSSQKLQDILKKAKFNGKKSMFSQNDSDSETEDKMPKFDCSGGLRLSGSDDSDSDDEDNVKKPKSTIIKKNSDEKRKLDLVNSINEDSGKPMMDLKAVHDNLERMNRAREKLSTYNTADNSTENTRDNDNIADLLAMGENSKKTGASQKRKNTQANDSDSDNWEEVEEDDSNAYKGPKESVEILLNSFGETTKKESKPVDVEAQLKRKFNRKRKEYQEHLHKTELMCWINHYDFVNQSLNDADLMKNALSMLPPSKNKSQYYPKDKTDIDYFSQITKWFKQTVSLKNTDMYCKLEKRPPIKMSLALQMKYKAAICRRDYVLMFIVLLRAIGIQCRMVQSVVADPKICPKSELMSLSKKEEKAAPKKPSNNSKSSKKSSNSSNRNSKSKKSSGKPKIPQLDGGDAGIPSEGRKKRELRIKRTDSFKVDESFVDLSNIKKSSSTPKRLSNGNSENFSPKVKVSISSTNQNKSSFSEKLKKNVKNDKVSQLMSPRKTRSASRDASPQVTTKTSQKKVENVKAKIDSKVKATKEDSEKPNTLQVFSPRRLRSRSRSTDENAQINNVKETAPKKPNLKSLTKKSPANTNVSDKPKDSLKVLSPRRLRSRSRSTDTQQNKSLNESRSKSASRKRESNSKANDNSESKKPKMASRKRPSAQDTSFESKKPKISVKEKIDEENVSDSDDSSLKYFKNVSSSKKKSTKTKTTEKSPKASTSLQIDRRILSSEDEAEPNKSSPSKKSKGIDIWIEVYAEKEEKWIAIDIFRNKIDCVKEICQKATHPLVYVFAWNNDKTVKDVSARYVANLNTTVRKMRVERNYLTSILKIYNAGSVRTTRDLKEDEELNQVQFDTPMPKSIAEFKNHPLYVLKRHLLKFQAIYPPEPPILGYIREEAIYPRDCCFTCHSRETWVKEARVVKLNEQPYKIVKTMKYDRAKNKVIKDVPLELFGIWQTKEYEPPTAENGIVPRNAYGNVELFKPCMLPHGTVHLQLPGLNKICRKLGIDCSQAIVGFDSSGGWPYPVYDGFVVCKEFEEKLIDAWNREQEEIEQKEREKVEKRVYGNWKKLIKGLYIRERLKLKYNFDDKP